MRIFYRYRPRFHTETRRAGYHYATHLISLNFDPNFYRSIQVNSDTDYLLLRLRQTHDIWHIVTGFGVDVMGEWLFWFLCGNEVYTDRISAK